MAKQILTSLNLGKNELQNARVQNLASAPSSPVSGQEYFDTTLNKLGVFNGTSWDYMGTGTSTGDFSSNTSTSVDGEVVVFSGTGGKTGKRATGTGIAKLTSGVLGTATAGTDYVGPTTGSAIQKGNGSGGLTAATAGTDYTSPAGTENLTNKTLDDSNAVTLKDTTGFTLEQTSDTTKKAKFAVNNSSTGTTLTFTLPNNAGTLATVGNTETFSNKTIDSDANTLKVRGMTLTASATNTGTISFPSVSGAATVVYNATTATLTNKTIDGGSNTFTNIPLSSAVTGTLAVANGGTGATTLTGVLKGNGTSAFTAATSGTDYSAGTAALATGILKSTTSTGALSIAVAGDFPTLNQNTTGTASTITGSITESQVTNLVSDLAAKEVTSNKSTSTTLGTSDTLYPSQNAVKTYVDNSVQGLSWKQSVRAIATSNITLSGTQTIDGVSLSAGDRVIVAGQTTASANGIYVVAAGAWSRSLDADAPSELYNATAYVNSGTINADTVWTITTDPTITIGTTSITWAQVNGGTVPTASTTTAGKVRLATTTEAIARTDATIAVTPAGLATFPQKYAQAIGDGTSTSIAVTHNLGTRDVTVTIYDAASYAVVDCDVALTSTTVATFGFAAAPASGAYRVVIVG